MRAMPDVTTDVNTEVPSTLQWVGMEDIAVPISMKVQKNHVQTISAKANVYVNLKDPSAKGIHMSRVHLVLNQLAELECNHENINTLLVNMVDSQDGISKEAKIQLSFDLLLKKSALLSNESGYQTYPVVITAIKTEKQFSYNIEFTITYSSTCPCSASLTRQLYADAIDEEFSESTINKSDLLQWVQSKDGSVATPHSQRSYATIRMSLDSDSWPDLPSLIMQFEEVIGTPVQTAVKRSDEQEFARLNASNLMFCEDAARRIKQSLEQMPFVKDYWLKVDHQESLHAHNAVVIDQKF